MKNMLIKLSMVTSAMLLLADMVSGQPVPPVKVAELPSIQNVITIDGINDERSWSEVQESTIFCRSAEEDWEGEADFSIDFQFCYGNTYLYLFVDMMDDIEHNWNGTDGEPWSFDNVEVFIQLDTLTVPSDYTDRTSQLRINRGLEDAWASTAGNVRNDAVIMWHQENTPDGWLFEAAIPWLGIIPAGERPENVWDYMDDVIGFEIHGADSDGNDPLVGAFRSGTQTAWDEDGVEGDEADGTEDLAWNNTSVFGYLELHDELYDCFDPDSIIDLSPENTKYPSKECLLYPNPVHDQLFISPAEQYCFLTLYTSTGVRVAQHKLNSPSIDVSSLQPGLYFAVIDGGMVVKFIKE